MRSELSIDVCFAALHATGWSVGSAAVDARHSRVWFVCGTKGEQKIMGRGLTEVEAWRAALESAEAASKA
jgi:hypothetical protein